MSAKCQLGPASQPAGSASGPMDDVPSRYPPLRRKGRFMKSISSQTGLEDASL